MLVGNTQIQTYLDKMIAEGRVGNALLFAGPKGVGKATFAKHLARKMLGSDHTPDLHVYQPAGKVALHPIDSMRQLSDEVHLPPTSSKHKVFIIDEADRMVSFSANALLKTFEEPPDDTLIILISSAPSHLLPTIRSRCRTLHFSPLSDAEVSDYLLAHDLDPRLSQRAHGSIGRALALANGATGRLHDELFRLLSKATTDYVEIKKYSGELAVQLEAIRDTITEEVNKELPPHLKEAAQKELEAESARAFQYELATFFEEILFWYRDRYLLNSFGDNAPLYHKDHAEAISHLPQPKPLVDVEKAVSNAMLAITRFGKVSNALEGLFLSL